MKIRLHVVVDKEDEKVVEIVQKALDKLCPTMSYSPSRLQPSLAGCMEFYATNELESEEIENLLSKLNNDWEGQKDDCQAYGFNTTMFHPNVYYLQFQTF